MRPWAIIFAVPVAFALAYVTSSTHLRDPLMGFPRIVLWAWDRPEDLHFLQAGSAGIAYLDRTLVLNGPDIRVKPRTAALQYNPGTALMAVIRIETSAGKPSESLPNPGEISASLIPASTAPGVRGLQIDFDARQSEREWYRRLLRNLRARLPATMPLLITALESWCDGDPWIRNLAVSDATPMLFQMGAGDRIPSKFSNRLCQSSVGVSMSEPPARLPGGRRIFFFEKRPWTRETYQIAVAAAGRWR